MKMMRYLSLFVLVLTFAVLVVACGTNDDTSANNIDENALDDYPEDRPINLVIPFGLGSGDAQARAFANIAQDFVGQQIIPNNYEGGSSAIGINHLLGQDPDGYTILFHSASYPLFIAQGALDLEIDDLKPIASFNADYLAFAVADDSPFETFNELVEYAHEHPGELNIGGTEIMGNHHVFAEMVMDGADIDMNYIPYDGAEETLNAMLGGNIDVMATAPSTVKQYIEVGDARLLGVSTTERVDAYPDVPTFYEMGLEDIDDYLNYRGYYAHPDTPDEIIEYLSDAFEEAANTQEWSDYLETEQQIEFINGSDEFADHIQTYYSNISELIDKLDVE